jgi:hypothetical protein
MVVDAFLPWKLVAPPFRFVEKGDKNDAAISCPVFVMQETKFRGKNCVHSRGGLVMKKNFWQTRTL